MQLHHPKIFHVIGRGNFADLLGEMKNIVKNEKLQYDLQQIIDETAFAAETHEMEHAYAQFLSIWK